MHAGGSRRLGIAAKSHPKALCRYEGLVLKSAAIGPFDFEVWLYSDGRILYLLEEFPTTNLTALEGTKG